MTGEYAFRPSSAELSRDDAVAVCTATLDLLRSEIDRAFVDAYSDYRDQLPSPVEQAQTALRALGAKQRRRDPGMGIKVRADDVEEWMLLREYAAWSIHVDLWSHSGRDLGTLHDCAHSIVLRLTTEQRVSLDAALAGIGTFVPLTDRPRRRLWPWRSGSART
jgi:hypothetical protein